MKARHSPAQARDDRDRLGRLPSFLIIGFPKAGTTSLAAYLAEHPHIFMSREKELHFFDTVGRNEAWYLDQFAEAGDASAIGEATPTYIFIRKALVRMAALVPNAKIIVLMRNPIDRAYSHYWWNRALFEQRDFGEAVREEMAQSRSIAPLAEDEEKGYRSYIGGGRYFEMIQRVGTFFPHESILPLILEDIEADPGAVYAAVCRFLGVEEREPVPSVGRVHNPAYRLRSRKLRMMMYRFHAWKRLPGSLAERIDRLNRVPFSYPPMQDDVRRELADWFRPANTELATFLNRSLDPEGWIQPRAPDADDSVHHV